jgi:hypothetical protein
MIQQLQTRLHSQVMASWFPNLGVLPKHVGHSTQMPNIELWNSG